jgi:outer membrane protein assembly factor BamB
MHYRLFIMPVVFLALSLVGADWRQWRGPGGSGLSDEKGLPTTWSAKDNLVWRAKLPGLGTSSPIVVGKRVYVTCYSGYGLGVYKKREKGEPEPEDLKDLKRHLVCIDRANGSILWTKNFDPLLPESNYYVHEGDFHGYASSTPASDGKNLYVFFGISGIYCFDLDGKQLWREDVGKGKRNWGSSNSPVLYKDLVIVNASVESGSIIAFDKTTGKQAWQAKGISDSWNTPVLVDAPGGTELVVNVSGAVLGLDPANGKELWRVKANGGYVCPSVVADKDTVYAVRGGVLAIKAGGRGDVTESNVLWKAGGGSQIPSPAYHDGRLYWVDRGGVFTCLDAADGKKVYAERVSKGGEFFASPLIADGKVYLVSRFTGGYVIAEGPKFKELAHNAFEDDKTRTNATPIAHEGNLLLRTDQYLYCLGKK